MRRPSLAVPSTVPRRRMAEIRRQDHLHLYSTVLADGSTVKAYYSHTDVIPVGTLVQLRYDPELHMHTIERNVLGLSGYTYLDVAPGIFDIREMMPDASQITKPWANKPTGLVEEASAYEFSPDGTQLAILWNNAANTQVHISRWTINSQSQRTWGALVEDFRVDLAIGVNCSVEITEDIAMAWSQDGKYIACMVRTTANRRQLFFGDADTSALRLISTQSFALSRAPLGVWISPNSSHVYWGKRSGASGFIGEMWHFNTATEAFTFVQDVSGFGAELIRPNSACWTGDSQTLFIAGNENGGVVSPYLGALVAYPVNADSTLGAPIYEQEETARSVPVTLHPTSDPYVDWIDINPTTNKIIVSNTEGLYVVDWTGSVWGDRSSYLVQNVFWENIAFWLDDEFFMFGQTLDQLFAGRYKTATNTVHAQTTTVVEENHGVNAGIFNAIAVRPPLGVKVRRAAPFPDQVPDPNPLA